ncbi:SKP1-like protein 21 [Pyrus ussuriensis x Pyrus communis]|uniref:SKP1-like protein 21 n=1 Tax=Pyrus ussuriensis x Pyrus communis TaxID=2448454 RepID=A0A5N5FH51_9ROSA|nr:SKP1-like protein 21 [Pyrus ussuriensis x Pyrus communis]
MSEGDMTVIKPEECKAFDEKYIRMDTKLLCELTTAADSLQLKPLVDLTSRALARIIEGKTPEEIREIFHLPDDLTEEEKLEPLKNSTDDPRIRLLNRLYARKRRELQEREKLKASLEVRKLCFTDSKGIKTSKNKKKNRRGKDQQKSTCLYEANEIHEVSSNLNFACPSDELNKFMPSSSLTLKLQDLKDDRVEDMIGFDDGNIDDEIDPALKEKTDRFCSEVEFRLAERMQEILSLGQERRPVPFSINGNGSFRRYACMFSFFLLFCSLSKASTVVVFFFFFFFSGYIILLSHK